MTSVSTGGADKSDIGSHGSLLRADADPYQASTIAKGLRT